MHIFVPSGGQVFDLLIDIPYSSISAMNIRQTLLDTELPNHPADVALELKEASTVVINSEKIDITELLLMVGNRSNAEKLLQTITKHSAAYVSAPYSLFASKKTSRTNSQESTRSKVSWADEPLEFKKEYVSSPNSPAVESSMACAADQGLELSDVVGQIERMDMYTSMPVAEMDNHIQVGAEVESSTSLTEPADEASMIIDDSVERDERRTSTTKDITESGRRDEAPRHAVSKRKEAPKPDVRPKKKDVADEGFQRGDIFEVAISPERTIARGSQPTAKKSAKIDSKPKSKVKARAKAPLTIAKKTSETKQPAKKMSQPLEKKTAKGSRTLVDAPDKHIPVLRKRNNKSMKELSDSEEPSSGDEVHGEDGAVVTGKLKKEQVTIIEKPIVTAAKAHSKKAEPAPSNPSAITQSPQQRQLLSAKQEGEPAHNAPQMPDDDSSIPQQRLPLSVAMEDDLVLHSSDEVAGEGHIVANIQKGRVAIDGAEQPTEIRVARKMGSIFAEAVSAATKRRERAARTYEPSLITAKVTTVSISEQRFIEPSSPSVEPIGRRSNQPAAPMTIPIPSRRSVMAEVVEMKQIPFKGNPAAKRDREHLSDSSSPFIDSDEKTLHSVQQSRQAPKGKEQLPSPKSKPQPRSEVPVEQTPQRLEPVPRGTPLLVDDYVARKTPLVAFDKNGPKNQGLSSFLRGSAIARIKAQDTASSASKHQSSAKKRARAAENHQSVDYNTTKKQRIIAMVDLVSSDDDTEDDKELSSQRIPTSSGILMRSGSSMSRVDHNGSPRVARSGGMTRFGSGLGRVLDGPTLALIDMSDEDGLAYVPSDDNEEDSSPENDSLFGGRKLPPLTGNRKVQPSGPNELVDFDKRYTPHHSVGNEYIAVKSKHTVIQEQAVDDPFTKQAIQETEKPSQTIPKQQRSNVEQSEESANQPRVATLRSLNRFVAFNKLDSRVTRQTVADPDKTLVEISVSDEPTFTRQQPKKYLNASSDSDTEDSEMGTESPGMQEPPPGQVWHDALRPYQQDLSNLLHYTVDVSNHPH